MTNKLSGILNNINVVKDEFKIIAIRLLPNTENSIKKIYKIVAKLLILGIISIITS